MSTYSTNLALELIGTGEQAGVWGNTTNTNLGTLIEQAISGYVTQAVATGTDTTITIPNGATGVARNMYIELTGTGGTNTNLIVPANKKLYFIFNNSTGAVTVKVSGQTGVSVPTGKKMVLVSNGTDIVNGLNYIADFGSNSATITQLTATSATITNLTLTSLVISNLSIASANITTLTATNETISGNLTLSGGTANGVLYLNGSKVATSGSALVFNGSDLTIGGTATNGKLNLLQSLSGASNAAGIWLSDNATTSMYLNNTSSGVSSVWTSGSLAFGVGNGTFAEAMRLTSTGLGIGTASPTRKLDVNGTIRITDGQSVEWGGTSLYIAGTSNTLLFGTSSAERMRLDASGNLGIGTASPGAKLDVVGTARFSGTNYFEFNTNVLTTLASDGVYIRSTISTAANPSYAWSGDIDTGMFTPGANTLGFTTGGSERMRLDSSGNLGIGTASPAARVHAQSAGGAGVFNFRATTTNLVNPNSTGSEIIGAQISIGTNIILSERQVTGAFVDRTDLAFVTNTGFGLGQSEKMRLDAAGTLGLGVTPSAWSIKALQVNNSSIANDSNDTYIQSNAFFDGSWKYINSAEAAQYYQVNGSHVWRYAASGTAGAAISFTQAMTLDASGNLGIGTASPAAQLHVISTMQVGAGANFGNKFTISDSLSSGATPFVIRDSANGDDIFTLSANSTSGEVKLDAADDNGVGYFSFCNNNVETMRLTAARNVGIGTASPAEKLQVNGSMRLQDTQATISLWKDGTPTKAGQLTFNTARGDAVGLGTFNGTSWSYSLFVDGNGSALAGQPSLATTATNGFLYVPTCAGTPTGTPTGITGMAPIVVNTTNNKLYFYSGGAWRDAGP